jgi:hypothetical protein
MARTQLVIIAAALLGLLAWTYLDGAGAADSAQPSGAATAPSAPSVELTQASERQPAVDAPKSEPVARAEQPAPPAPAEMDLGALAGPELPAGTIEVHALQGTQPLACEVELSRFEQSIVIAEQLSGPREALERRRTDEHGTALFGGLDSGDYTLRAALEDGSTLDAYASLAEDALHGEHVWILFGEGGIRGRVFGPSGAARAGVRVVVSAWHLPSRTEVETGWDGAYSVGGLRSGDYSVEELVQAGEPKNEGSSLHVQLAPGEWKTVDLGGAGGLVHWTGTLRLSDGQPASGPAQLELDELERGEKRTVQVGADGRIATDLAAGRYAVRIWSLGDPLPLREVTLEPGQGELDLLLPGAEVVGRARWSESAITPGEDPTASHVQVWLKSVERPERKGFASTDEQGRFVLRGLEAGDWALDVYPGKVSGAPLDGLVVRIVAGTARVELDLELAAQ